MNLTKSLSETINAFGHQAVHLLKWEALMFLVKKLFWFSMMLLIVAGCQQKKETRAESNSPAKDAQSQIAQTPAPPPAPSVSEPKYDYTDARDIKMDGAKAIGKTAKLKILMDYSGAEEGHFRAAPCDGDNN